ncbi:MAG: ribulose-phosphate 3-epimerase [Nanoarchaeota archaeon]
MAKITVSILNADYGHMQDFVDSMSNADAIQFDVMDGHFVPNLTMGPEMVRCIKTNLFKEVHLMVTNPSLFVKPFSDAGVDRIIFHVEVKENIDKVIKLIRKESKQVGLAVSMKTPIKKVLPYLKKVDMLIIMPITPGFGGQAFNPKVLDKIKTIRKISGIEIQADGGINDLTGRQCIDAGADNLLVGTFISRSKNPRETVEILKKL